MKKSIYKLALAGSMLSSLLLSTTPLVSAHEGHLHLTLNGVQVDQQPNALVHMMPNQRAYASVDFITKFYGTTYNWDDSTKTLTIGGTVVSDVYGKVHVLGGVVTAPIRSIISAIGGDHSEIGWEGANQQVNATVLPAGVIPLDGHFVVPQMGEHWANPANLPLGPIYGVFNGKLVFLEYMPDKDLNKTVHDIGGTSVPTPSKIDHTDIDWNPQGHPGDLAPHYDVHLYYVTRDEQNKIK